MTSDDHFKSLLAKARSLPRVAGVYLMKDAEGHIIYIGKAVSLPDRVSSYFIPSMTSGRGRNTLGPKKQQMLDLIVDFDTIECAGEWEALLTENRLIKDVHPRFNERLIDDKTYPYLVVTLRDDYPGVFVTREPAAEAYRKARVFGPFTSVSALREAVQLLQRVFKFRTCHLDIRENDQGKRHFRPCLLYAIKQCTAPCADRITRVDYRRDVDRFLQFLGSKRSAMLRGMRTDMEKAAKDLRYEDAATLRDQIRAIEKLDERGSHRDGWQPETESFSVDPAKGLESLRRTLGCEEPIRCIECIDIAHLQGGETVGSKVCFVDGRPLKNEYRRYRIQQAGGGDDYAAIREVVARRYREAGSGNELYPDVIVIDGGLGQLHAAQEGFSQFNVCPPMVISLAKKEELIHVQDRPDPIRLGRENFGLRLCQAIRDEAHRFAQHYHHILRRKSVVGEKSEEGRNKK